MEEGVMRRLLSDAIGGYRLSCEDGLALMKARGRIVWEIAGAADEARSARAGDVVTYVRNQNINVTNICVNSCGFCGFSRRMGEPGAYFHDDETIRKKATEAKERRVTEICTVSGLHPEFDASSYLHIYDLIREAAPGLHIHASNPMEVAYAAEKSGCSTVEVLEAMKSHGLGSLCGTAAEILDDRVRRVICPQKIDTENWVRVIREAHGLGIPSTATIMYGSYEGEESRIKHLSILREIQDETQGFTEFVPLSYIHLNTPLFRKGMAKAGATGREDVLMLAVSRLFLDNFRNIQVSWVKLGVKMAQLGLMAGANDLGGTMFEESISKGAGAKETDYLDPEEMRRMALDLGRGFRERTTLYRLI